MNLFVDMSNNMSTNMHAHMLAETCVPQPLKDDAMQPCHKQVELGALSWRLENIRVGGNTLTSNSKYVCNHS